MTYRFGIGTFIFIFHLSLMADESRILMQKSSPAIKINCTESIDQTERVTIDDCLRQFGNRKPLCRGLSAESAYNNSWMPWESNNFKEPRFESYYVDIPKEFSSEKIGENILWKSWERNLVIKDANTGKIFSIQRIQMEKAGKETKTVGTPKVYFNPAAPFPGFDQNKEKFSYRSINPEETGLGTDSQSDAQKKWDGLISEVTRLGSLENCDFMKEASIPTKFNSDDSYFKSCLKQERALDNGEMEGIGCNLGLSSSFTSQLNLSGQVNSSLFLNLLTGTALDNFIKGYSSLTGEFPEAKELIKLNPACRDFSNLFIDFKKDKTSQALIKKEVQKRRDPKSLYLKNLRSQAEIRKGINYKSITPENLTMAELLHQDERCKSAKAQLKVLDGTSQSSAERTKSYEQKSIARRELLDFNCEEAQKKIPQEIRKREAQFPELSNHYDAESNDSLWAKPYDLHSGRHFINELSKISPKNLKAIKTLADKQLEKHSEKMKEVIADTCSATDLECRDTSKMCWHTLMSMKELTNKVAASANPSFNSIYQCLLKEQQRQEFESNLSAIGSGLACSGLGMIAGLASGGVTLPATLSAASVACGLGASVLIDGKIQSSALTNLELTRGCFEISDFCTEDQVNEAIESAWWSIFGKKVSLGSEGLGLASEVKGILNLLNEIQGPSKEIVFKAIVEATKQSQNLDEAIKLAKKILTDYNTPEGSKMIVLSLDQDLFSRVNPSIYQDLPTLDAKISYLKSINPQLPEAFYAQAINHLDNSKDLKGTILISDLIKRRGEESELSIKELIRDPNLTSHEFLERLTILFSATQNSKISGASLSAQKALEDLLTDPSIREKINEAVKSCSI